MAQPCYPCINVNDIFVPFLTWPYIGVELRVEGCKVSRLGSEDWVIGAYVGVEWLVESGIWTSLLDTFGKGWTLWNFEEVLARQ